jgi:superfamily II RNA helicase
VPVKKDKKLTRDEVRSQLLKRLTSNPVDMILKMRDSLLLTEKQVAQMETISKSFMSHADSLFKPIEDYVLEKGQDTEDKELMKRIGDVQPKMQKAMLTTLRDVTKLLTDDQLDKLPPPLQAFVQMAEQEKDRG